ncbi:hypothetical protein N7540_000398 [Penicillium herquei]|nr:hypothetical protein N7540_000398 [Penicillium herquei]
MLIEWQWQRGKTIKKIPNETEPTLITNEGQDLESLKKAPPTLITNEGQDLPDAWNELVERQPQSILKGLKHVWNSRPKVLHDDSTKRMLQATDASQLCHTRIPQKCRLNETYLPLPHLKEQCAQFMEKDEVFPFLKLDVDEINSWLFLHTELGVKNDDNIEFLLDILKWIKISNSKSGRIKDPGRISRIYSTISTKFVCAGGNWMLKEGINELVLQKEQRSQNSAVVSGFYKYLHHIGGLPSEQLKSIFQDESLVLATKDSQPGWYKPSECLWSNAIQQPGEVILKDYPAELERFFIESVGVQLEPSKIQMVCNDPLETNEKADISKIKSKIRSLGYYSPLSQDDQPSSPIPNHSTGNIKSKSPPSRHADLFRKHLEAGGFSFVENQWYKDILDRVVPLARLTNFPSRGDLNKSARRQLLPWSLYHNYYKGFIGVELQRKSHASPSNSQSQGERDFKIGAAGELYVFELLGGQSLPNWGYHNWPSTIRHLVKVHSTHADIQPWHGTETADIVYDDTEGSFTALLILNGYLDPIKWMNRRPKYYIEVKATVGPSGTPFFMSRNQIKQMVEIHRKNLASDYSEVYMVCHVFFIQGPDIGMCVYVDPQQLRHGELQFNQNTKGDHWSVVPR